MQSSNSSPVNFTFDYDLFEFFDGNRPPTHWRRIMQSIEKKDLTKFVPILTTLVKGKFYIIDGQNRFLACKALRKPIYYMVLPLDCDEETMYILNVDRKNWTLENYLNFWVTQGNSHYIRVQAMLNECSNLRVNHIINIWQYRTSGDDKGAAKAFKDGAYTMPEKAIAKIRIVSNILFVIENVVEPKEFGKSPKSSLVSAVSSLLVCGANPQILIDRIKTYPHLFRKQPDQAHYFAMLEHIYNYRTRDKIAFKYRIGKQGIETYY